MVFPDNIKRSLEVTFNEIDKNTVELIEEKQHLATEVGRRDVCTAWHCLRPFSTSFPRRFTDVDIFTQKAIKHLDKNSRQEVRESAWLQKEVLNRAVGMCYGHESSDH